MSTRIDSKEVQSSFDEILARVKSGEEITVTDPNGPIARIVPVNSEDVDRELGFGMFKGKVWMSEDFDAPLSEDELREWEK
jgi:prevent-host-death family protein